MTTSVDVRRRSQQSRSTWRLQLFGICVLLTFLVFRQAPGQVTSDTKLDLVVDPWGFLSRAANFWDPLSSAGTIQNQAYGYLFPMGPFFGLMHSIGLEPWVTQRLWESLLVCLAFLGAQKLAAALGTHSRTAQIAAGLTYALAPRLLSELTTISSELMPVVALPWLMLPLVEGARKGSTRVAGALSGAAFALAGGVNATASLAILPVPAWWLITRARGPRRRSLATWWGFSTLLAIAWWFAPLLMLGKYSPPFLKWIESAQTTTLHMSPFAVVRGGTQWVSYLGTGIWPGGYQFVATPAIVAATALTVALALFGLTNRSARHRLFLLPLLVGGTAVMTLGFIGESSPVWAQWAQDLLDGPLAAFRNIHKFDPVVRLPVAIAVGFAISRLITLTRPRTSGRRSFATYRPLVAFGALCLAVVCALPMLNYSLAVNPRDQSNAYWWDQTGTWLEEHSDGARALVVPGSSNAAFVWGKTVDDPLQPEAGSPWTVRDAIPLTQPDYIRFLDAVEQSFRGAVPDSALATLLRNSGIGYVVLRNDIDAFASQATPSEAVRATLESSPGFTRVQVFGPEMSFDGGPSNLVNAGMSEPRAAIEIYALDGGTDLVSLLPANAALQANGAADNLTSTLQNQLGDYGSVVFAADAGSPGMGPWPAGQSTTVPIGPGLLTEGIRKQQATFGGNIGKSKTLSESEQFIGNRVEYDYLPENAALSAYTYDGIKDVYATTSGDAIYAASNASPLNGPWSALDGNRETAWYSSSPYGAIGQSLTIEFDQPARIDPFYIRFPAGLSAYPTHLQITTDDGTTQVAGVNPDDQLQAVTIRSVTASSINIQAITMADDQNAGSSFAIADLNFPGVTPARYLNIPGTYQPAFIHFEREAGARNDCRTVDGRTYCDSGAATYSQEQYQIAREFTLAAPQEMELSATVEFLPGSTLNEQLDIGSSPIINASSGSSADPRLRAQNVLDDDPTTYWQAREGDQEPWITLLYSQPFATSGLTIDVDPADPLSRPEVVRVSLGGSVWTGELPDDGYIDFGQPITTQGIRIDILKANITQTTSTFNGRTSLVPTGISKLVVDGAPPPTPGPETIHLPCGFGPQVIVNDHPINLDINATRAELSSGLPVRATACGGELAQLQAGVNHVSLSSERLTSPVSIDLNLPGAPLSASTSAQAPGGYVVRNWTAMDRTINVDSPEAGVLVVAENANDGWQGTLNGTTLEKVTINGWQQGYLLPAGSKGDVQLTFVPGPIVRDALGVGAAGLVVLAFLGVWPSRTSRRMPAVGEARPGLIVRLLLGAALLGCGYALVGTWGLVGGLVTTALWLLLAERRVPRWFALTPSLVMIAATTIVVFGTAPEMLDRHRTALPNVLVYVALVLACVSALFRRRPER